MEKGLLHMYYGDGKGKTSAAIGLGIRACGQEKSVSMARFLKGETSGELAVLKHIPNFSVIPGPKSVKFFAGMSEQEKAAYREQADRMWQEAISSNCDVLILDELLDAVDLEILSLADVLAFLHNKPESMEVILTGHTLMMELLLQADYATEMKKLKHPYEKGVSARRGIEY